MKPQFSSLMSRKLALLVISVLALTSFAAADVIGYTTTSYVPQMFQSYAPQMFQAGTFPLTDPVYLFTFSMGGNTGSALLSTTALGGGEFLVTSGTLHVTGGADIGTYNLIPGGPAPFTSPSGAFIADNVLYPASDPILDTNGLLFGNGSLEINIWGNSPGNYSFYSWDGSSYNVQFTGQGTATATLVPEASTLATLLGFGIFNLAAVLGVRRKLI